jgi:hypothetical protein
MPVVQRTFELVPTTMAKSSGHRPPMTSKAAKKAYQKASAAPKISRAEQRKRDAAELERHRKEYEKERAAAKAKAAREKKAAKANAEREERKRMGLPEPSRFVRASQPTISVFVRGGNGNGKRSWQQMDATADEANTENQVQQPPPEGITEDHPCEDPNLAIGNAANPAPKIITAEPESEDEFGEFPSLSQTNILETIDSPIWSTEPATTTIIYGADKEQEIKPHEPPPELLQNRSVLHVDKHRSDMAQAPNFPEVEPISKTKTEHISPKSSNDGTELLNVSTEAQRIFPTTDDGVHIASPTCNIQPPKKTVFSNDNMTAPSAPATMISALRERSIDMPPPRIPMNSAARKQVYSPASKNPFAPQRPGRPSATISPYTPRPNPVSNSSKSMPAPPSRNPRFLPDSYNRNFPSIPPSATQAFLENHLDDFFPSPTQEIRELMDDAESLPSNTQVARELSPARLVRANKIDFNPYNLLCTQDLLLSSQDIREIDTPSITPIPNTKNQVNSEQQAVALPVLRPEVGEKRRFFVEKEEDIPNPNPDLARPIKATENQEPEFLSGDTPSLQAAIAESKALAEIRHLADACFDNFSDDIDSLEETIRESEILLLGKGQAQKHELVEDIRAVGLGLQESDPLADIVSGGKQTTTKPLPRRYFQEKEEDLLLAALHDSKHLEAQKYPTVVPLDAKACVKRTRTLKRAPSGFSDYGTELISSQELLELF